MTIIEQRAAESMAKNLPLILKELKRANELKALHIRMGIEQSVSSHHDSQRYENTLEAIMNGI